MRELKALGSGSDSLEDIEAIITGRLASGEVKAERKPEAESELSQGPAADSPTVTEAKERKSDQPCEDLMARALATHVVVEETMRADRSGFGAGASLHSSYDVVTRFETEIIVKERRIRVETVTDLHSGKSVRADLSGLGPERSKITWSSLALLICLVIEAAMPFDRLQKVLYSAFGIFSTSSICRHFQAAAQKLAPIYLWLVTELAQKALILAGDDSHTRCIEMELNVMRGLHNKDDELDPLVKFVAEKLGRSFPYKRDPKKPKHGIFVSHVHGRTVADDPRSTIFIYRTHYGHYGNLLSKMLAMRPSTAPQVIIQGDLSPSNYPEPLLLLRWVTRFVGCAAHARRPFKRYENDDPPLCDRMLELFALLTAAEKRIFADARPPGEIERLRKKLEFPIWEEIKNLAASVIEAEKRKCLGSLLHRLWPKKAPLYAACRYIVKNFPELTAYLEDARLEYNNNRSERLLRGEKILLVSSKFRWSEVGRVSLDILRSLVMTAKVAEVSPRAYFTWVLAQPQKDVEKNPQDYTPLAYRTRIHSMSSSQATGS
ncbi:MAG: transposase [Pseudobdellovibrionaceae bacterium]|nr:transposase [Pseudobdellovibrionaceae bacterium]